MAVYALLEKSEMQSQRNCHVRSPDRVTLMLLRLSINRLAQNLTTCSRTHSAHARCLCLSSVAALTYLKYNYCSLKLKTDATSTEL
jgi:hypothetical protein